MRKSITLALIVIVVASLLLVIPTRVNGQVEQLSMKVLSYSTYTSTFTGDFIVVGEVQNTGSRTINQSYPQATAYTKDGQAAATPMWGGFYGYTTGNVLAPGQTAPLYFEFSAESSVSGNLSWVQNFDRVEFSFVGKTTDNVVDPGVQIMAHVVSSVSPNYTVTGVVFNRGNFYPRQTWVTGVFYDAAGKVVAVGASNNVASYLAPNASAQFTLTPYDPPTNVASQIASYNLTLLTSDLLTSAPTPTPTQSSTPTSQPSGSANPTYSQPPTSNPSNTLTISMDTVYIIIAIVVVVIVVLVLAVVLRRGKKSKT